MPSTRASSPIPALTLDKDGPTGEDPEGDRHKRADRGESTESKERGALVSAVAAGLGEHLDPVEERKQTQAEGEDRDDAEYDEATD